MPFSEDEKFTVATAMQAFTRPAITNIVGVIGTADDNHGVQVGMGTFLRLPDEGDFVITNDHTYTKQTRKYLGLLHTRGHGKTPGELPPPIALEPAPLDLALVRLPATALANTPVQPAVPEILAADDLALDDDLYFVQGSTESEAQHHFGAFINQPVSFATELTSTNDPAVNEQYHFSIDWPTNRRLPSNAGRTVYLPTDLEGVSRGFSGSSVWKTNYAANRSDWNPSQAKIVGIVWRRNLPSASLVATHIHWVRQFLGRWTTIS